MKYVGAFLILIFLIQLSAAAIQVEEKEISSVVIAETKNPALFEFTIKNSGNNEFFELYSFVGVDMTPRGTFEIAPGTNVIEVGAYPSAEVRRKNEGPFVFEYIISGKESGTYKDTLKIKIVPLSQAIGILPAIAYPDKQVIVPIKNYENIQLNDVQFDFSSKFFNSQETISLKPYEQKNITLTINKDVTGVKAGQYNIDTNVKYEEAKAEISSTIDYREQSGLSVSRSTEGFIVRTTTVEKKNAGNVPVVAQISERKDVLTRLFTTYSERPTSTQRNGLFVNYNWERELQPGESLLIDLSTNYTFPFLLIILIVGATFAVKFYSTKSIILSKRVSFVRTKGGEMALQVRVNVRAKRHVDNVQIIDSIPMVAKLYDKFGTQPSKIDEATRRMFWNISRLNAGEERTFSYIIYSKLNVVGNFELPAATAIYEQGGKTFDVYSNKTSFVSGSKN